MLKLAAGAAAVVLLAGSTTTALSVSPAPTPTFTAVSYPMPDLGPEPSMPPLSDAEAEAQRLLDQDAYWQNAVLRQFPDAVRPEVVFAGYVSDADRIEVLSACFTAAGVPFGLGRDKNGVVAGFSLDGLSQDETVAAFVCEQEHPSRPMAPPDAHVLGWFYDYLTEFLAPCYAANGIQNPPPPTRDYFIENYPNQNWWPSQGVLSMTADGDALQAACPPAK